MSTDRVTVAERGRSVPRLLLHVEGAAVFVAATVAYFALGHPWWLYLLLLLAPDLSFLGYLAGPRAGSVIYNLAHLMAWPLALLAVGWWLEAGTAVAVALIWLAHIGMDRAVGYGFKYPTAFKDTHFDRV